MFSQTLCQIKYIWWFWWWAKNNYYMLAKLSNPSTSSKRYWSILKKFRNNKKIPFIPPTFVGNKSKTDFKMEVNQVFASKYTPITNDNSLSSLSEFYPLQTFFYEYYISLSLSLSLYIYIYVYMYIYIIYILYIKYKI